MLWLSIAAAGGGVLLGLWLRVPAVCAASVAVVVNVVVLMTIERRPLLEAVAYASLLVIILQLGYLVGLLLSGTRARVTSRDPSHVSTCRR
jgi:hypothetical protein